MANSGRQMLHCFRKEWFRDRQRGRKSRYPVSTFHIRQLPVDLLGLSGLPMIRRACEFVDFFWNFGRSDPVAAGTITPFDVTVEIAPQILKIKALYLR